MNREVVKDAMARLQKRVVVPPDFTKEQPHEAARRIAQLQRAQVMRVVQDPNLVFARFTG